MIYYLVQWLIQVQSLANDQSRKQKAYFDSFLPFLASLILPSSFREIPRLQSAFTLVGCNWRPLVQSFSASKYLQSSVSVLREYHMVLTHLLLFK